MGLKYGIKRVDLLGGPTNLLFKAGQDGLIVDLPSQAPCNNAFVLRIQGEFA